MELIQQLEGWRQQLADSPDAEFADIDVARRLIDHGIEALQEAKRLRDAANVALGHLTGGMDGDWRDCDPAELLRSALRHNAK